MTDVALTLEQRSPTFFGATDRFMTTIFSQTGTAALEHTLGEDPSCLYCVYT